MATTTTAAKLDLNLRYLGFCGADDSVDPQLLSLLSLHYPFIEWGVLFRPDLEGTARYATTEWVDRLAATKKQASHAIHLAAHLCGSRCADVLEGKTDFLTRLYEWGFRRVQINATKANNVQVNASNLDSIVDNLRKAIVSFPQLEFIIQCNAETQPIFSRLESDASKVPANMSFLYDSSCGAGVAITEESLPPVHAVVPSGFAGGIGPNNIDSILTLVAKKTPSSSRVWVDMESSLREFVAKNKKDPNEGFNDVFSITHCFACVQVAIRLLALPTNN